MSQSARVVTKSAYDALLVIALTTHRSCCGYPAHIFA